MNSHNAKTAAFFTYLIQSCGYSDVRDNGNGTYACVMPLMFTHAIIVGLMGNRESYEDRWCYSSYEKAKAALDAWDGTGEPEGWHRHPLTGRRREVVDGEVLSEHVAM